jgi:hypothetical protein
MTQKRQCHARESGHPDLAARAGALDSRLRGNDTTLKNLFLNDAPHQGRETIFLRGYLDAAEQARRPRTYAAH